MRESLRAPRVGTEVITVNTPNTENYPAFEMIARSFVFPSNGNVGGVGGGKLLFFCIVAVPVGLGFKEAFRTLPRMGTE